MRDLAYYEKQISDHVAMFRNCRETYANRPGLNPQIVRAARHHARVNISQLRFYTRFIREEIMSDVIGNAKTHSCDAAVDMLDGVTYHGPIWRDNDSFFVVYQNERHDLVHQNGRWILSVDAFRPETLLPIAAASLADLRRCDVYRVISSAPENCERIMARYITDGRPDLANEVRDVLEELADDMLLSSRD